MSPSAGLSTVFPLHFGADNPVPRPGGYLCIHNIDVRGSDILLLGALLTRSCRTLFFVCSGWLDVETLCNMELRCVLFCFMPERVDKESELDAFIRSVGVFCKNDDGAV